MKSSALKLSNKKFLKMQYFLSFKISEYIFYHKSQSLFFKIGFFLENLNIKFNRKRFFKFSPSL